MVCFSSPKTKRSRASPVAMARRSLSLSPEVTSYQSANGDHSFQMMDSRSRSRSPDVTCLGPRSPDQWVRSRSSPARNHAGRIDCNEYTPQLFPQDYDAVPSTSNQHWGRFQEYGPENSYIYPSDNEDEYDNDGPNHANSNHFVDCFQDRGFDKYPKYSGHGASHCFTGNDSNFPPRCFTGIERFAPDSVVGHYQEQEQFGCPPKLSFGSNDCYTLGSPDNFTDMAGWKQGNKAYSRSG